MILILCIILLRDLATSYCIEDPGKEIEKMVKRSCDQTKKRIDRDAKEMEEENKAMRKSIEKSKPAVNAIAENTIKKTHKELQGNLKDFLKKENADKNTENIEKGGKEVDQDDEDFSVRVKYKIANLPPEILESYKNYFEAECKQNFEDGFQGEMDKELKSKDQMDSDKQGECTITFDMGKKLTIEFNYKCKYMKIKGRTTNTQSSSSQISTST